MHCPCCDQPVPNVPVSSIREGHFSIQERQILDILIESYPRQVTAGFIIDALYSERSDGGPLTARNIVSVRINSIRKKISAFGWVIPNSKCGASNYGVYKLAVKRQEFTSIGEAATRVVSNIRRPQESKKRKLIKYAGAE